ncbi:MAG: TIGR01548 family HAD-type hydrolase [Synechococcales cyanobacterium T60_A2020_003]|nr:TIGR01548 family HAD-type hydrolase [Synechococcales cyanobacterium T60_A2020_003]
MNAIAIFDIDGVLRDVGNSYRRALADTVEHFTGGAYRPTQEDIDTLKAEGIWNNDWEGSREFIYRYFESQGKGRSQNPLDFDAVIDFFQRKYRGEDLENPDAWTGYISQEPLLVSPAYFQQLTEAKVAWGFFSGATPGSARYVLERRLRLTDPVLIAMGDAPDKPDPTGLLEVARRLEAQLGLPEAAPVIYAGDTVADLHTVTNARQARASRPWIGVGILPPHAQHTPDYQAAYTAKLREAGALTVLPNLEALTAECIQSLIEQF